MTAGKSKQRISSSKKGQKKKAVDSFASKDWYKIRVPSYFDKNVVGVTLANRTQGLKTVEESLKGRQLKMSLGDLNHKSEDLAFRQVTLRIDDVQGDSCLTNFHEMSFTSDKLRSIIKKWHTLIEAYTNVRTTDGYLLRVFCIATTRRASNQVKKTCYANTSKVRRIRKKMVETIIREVSGSSLKDVVKKLIPDSIGKDIERGCRSIFPLQNVFIRKVKIIKRPKFTQEELKDIHGGSFVSEELGSRVEIKQEDE